MKLFLLLAVCVATVVNGGQIHLFRRTSTELVDLFSELGTDLATKLADKLEAIDLDLTKPITEEDPEKTWRAVETVVTTVVEEVIPTDCGEAVTVHAIVGYARHLVMEVVVKDMLYTTEEIGELTHLTGLKARMSGDIPDVYRDMKPRPMSRIHKLKIAYREGRKEMDLPTGEETEVEDTVKEVMTKIAEEVKGKLATVESAIGRLHMGRLFWEMQTLIDADILVNKPIGEVIKKVANTIHKYMEPFKTGEVSCDVTADMEEIERSLGDIIDFLDGGFEETLEDLRIPSLIEEIVKGNLLATLPKVAEILKEIVEPVPSKETVRFIVSLFRESAEDFFRGVEISRLVEEVVRERRLTTFVEKLIKERKTEEIANLMLKTTAMTLGDLELSPEEIDAVLTGIVETAVEGKLPEEAGPRGEFPVPSDRWAGIVLG